MPLDRGQAKSQLYLMYHCQSNQKLMKPPSQSQFNRFSLQWWSIADLNRGQVISIFINIHQAKSFFALHPDPPIFGFLNQNTSSFFNAGPQRLIELMPKLMNIRLRRSWRGTYPITPDGLPILGPVESVKGYLLATGLCGQGFMLGPGVARLLTHLIEGNLNAKEQNCLESLSIERAFTSVEKLK